MSFWGQRSIRGGWWGRGSVGVHGGPRGSTREAGRKATPPPKTSAASAHPTPSTSVVGDPLRFRFFFFKFKLQFQFTLLFPYIYIYIYIFGVVSVSSCATIDHN